MAVARRSLLDDGADQEQDPSVDNLLQPDQPPMTMASSGQSQQTDPGQDPNGVLSQHDVSGILPGDRPPADPAYMPNAPAGAVSNLPVPAGYDATKWNDPNNPSYGDWKYTAGRIVAGGGSPEDVAKAIGGKVYSPGSDWVIAPDGEVYDTTIDFGPGGQNAPEWAHIDFDANGNYIPPNFGAPAGGGGGGGVAGGSGILAPGYTGPGDGGVYGGDILQQVGQDPMSQLIDSGIAGLIQNGGKTQLGGDLEETIRTILANGGQLNPDTMNARFESARELENKGFRSQLNDARGALASRGLLSEPGQPSGVEAGSVRRISEGLAPDFARNIRDIISDESGKSDDRLMQSLTLATGLSHDQAANLLAATQQGTDRQSALADIALKSLDQNIEWNKFIAQFGLDRDTMLYQIQAGNSDSILPILSLFMQMLSQSRSGYVGGDTTGATHTPTDTTGKNSGV